jgi:hypothetical protein
MWGFGSDDAQIRTVPSLSLGAEVAYLRHPFIVLAGADMRLAGATVPYHVGGEVSAGWMIQKVLALESTLAASREWIGFTDTDGADAGAVRDTDFRLGIGVAVWR